MGTATGEFRDIGPMISIRIAPFSASGQRGLPIFVGVALVDTGSMVSSISDDVAAKLGLKPIGQTTGLAMDSVEVKTQNYAVNLYLDSRVAPFQLEIPSFKMENCDAVIGMDIIRSHILTLNGWNQRIVLHCNG